MQVERGEHRERSEGCTGRYQSWCDGLEAPKDWLEEQYFWGLRATVCVIATTLCVTERDNHQEAQEAQYKREMQLGASKEQEMVRAERKT